MADSNLPIVFENNEFGRLDTIIIDNEPWFIGKQVAAMLGYKDTDKAVRDHAEDADKKLLTYSEIQSRHISGFTSPRGLTLINEYGVSDLFLLSKLPAAKKFRHWFTHEVLPSIRKTGSYSLPTVPQITPPTGKLSAALDELNATTKRLCDIFGVNKGIALSKATALVENNYPVNLEGIKDLLPPAETDVGLLNPTQIRDMLGYDISPQFINRNLIELGLQKQVKNGYQLTEAGKEFGEMMPYTRNGHSGYRPLWRTSIVEKLREHITPCDVVAEKIFGEE